MSPPSAALGGVILVMIRLRPAGRGVRPWQLHAARDGAAAFEFVLVLPVALMILLVVAQSALLFNANMVVQYSAYATVRVASTLIPQEIGNELRNLVNNPDSASVPASTKLARLRRAAATLRKPWESVTTRAGGRRSRSSASRSSRSLTTRQ